MRELTPQDAVDAAVGGGFFAAGGGGWAHHGELMGSLATSVGTPVLATVDELPADSWVATVTAIGAPASPHWEIRPLDYVAALRRLSEATEHPIAAVMTAQNGYSTSLNGWIQSAVTGVKVLDAAGDVRAHPTGKLGSLGLTTRPGYETVQVVAGGNRERHGYFEAVLRGTVTTCDDVLRDISVRTGGFIAAARNPVELDWVRGSAALGSISLAIELGRDIRAAQPDGARAVIEAICNRVGGKIVAESPLRFTSPLRTEGGFDHGTVGLGSGGADVTVPFLNEFMAVDGDGQRLASYPDTIALLSLDSGLPLAVKDLADGMPAAAVVAPAAGLPCSTSARDELALREVEHIMGLELVRYLDGAAA
ncbi:MAG TPA: DUF917 family protein [Pseudonocardia sp.]|jgi:hypothetical protein|nr:DUF917 family protein [Pseudonocardia sp.]